MSESRPSRTFSTNNAPSSIDSAAAGADNVSCPRILYSMDCGLLLLCFALVVATACILISFKVWSWMNKAFANHCQLIVNESAIFLIDFNPTNDWIASGACVPDYKRYCIWLACMFYFHHSCLHFFGRNSCQKSVRCWKPADKLLLKKISSAASASEWWCIGESLLHAFSTRLFAETVPLCPCNTIYTHKIIKSVQPDAVTSFKCNKTMKIEA